MRNRIALLLTILALILAPVAGLACDGSECTCTGSTDAVKLANNARNGCEASTAALIKLAKKSDDAEAVMLATKAAGGCEQSQAALIALVTETDNQAETQTASDVDMVQLAKNASSLQVSSTDWQLPDLILLALSSCSMSTS